MSNLRLGDLVQIKLGDVLLPGRMIYVRPGVCVKYDDPYKQCYYGDDQYLIYIERLPGVDGIEEFLSSPSPNQWVQCSTFSAYLRKGRRNLEFARQASYRLNPTRDQAGVGQALLASKNQVLTTLDLGSLTVHEERQGHAKRLIWYLLERNPYSAVYVENVLNPVLKDYLLSMDWYELEVEPPSYYKLKDYAIN